MHPNSKLSKVLNRSKNEQVYLFTTGQMVTVVTNVNLYLLVNFKYRIFIIWTLVSRSE